MGLRQDEVHGQRVLREQPTITQVMSYIDEHLSDELTIEQLARISCMSASRFKQVFKQNVGLPVHNYIIRRRTEQAATLLETTMMPVAVIAAVCGYQKPSSLAKAFKKYWGTLPLKYRQQHHGRLN